jgi:hypothetical protein
MLALDPSKLADLAIPAAGEKRFRHACDRHVIYAE